MAITSTFTAIKDILNYLQTHLWRELFIAKKSTSDATDMVVYPFPTEARNRELEFAGRFQQVKQLETIF